MSSRYRHKPFYVDAIRWDGANCVDVFAFLDYPHEPHDDEIDEVLIEQPDGGHLAAHVGDWIVRREDGRAFPLRHELFTKAYEPVGEGGSPWTATNLPEASIVVDDLCGIAWYANGAPGENRWCSTEHGGDGAADSVVDYALRHGATVVRVGYGEDVMTDHISKVDVVQPDGTHLYWSTHCRHDRHVDCAAIELAPGVPRRPAQCKTCGAPCLCPCGHPGATP